MITASRIPSICHRCLLPVPRRARACPHCAVPLQNITLSGALANTLLIALTIVALLVLGYLIYQLLGFSDDVPGLLTTCFHVLRSAFPGAIYVQPAA